MQKAAASVRSIEAVVQAGRAVIAADRGTLTAMMRDTIRAGRSATFFVAPDDAQAVMRWFWTPGRVREHGLEPIAKSERAKIEKQLGVPGPGGFSNRIKCTSCGAVYGEYEFMEQGIAEHGKEWVKAVLELKDTAVLRINPSQDAICGKCGEHLIGIHDYAMYSDPPYYRFIYGCCSGEIPGTILA